MDMALVGEALRAAAIPVVSVRNRDGVLTVQYTAEATAEQRAAGDALVAGWDGAAEQRKASRRLARQALVGVDDPVQIASRNALRVIYLSVVETRQAFNALRSYMADPQGNPLPAALPIRTWKQALAAVRQQIDAETDPEA